MSQIRRPWQVLVVAAAGWISQHQDVIDFLREEHRVLKQQLRGIVTPDP